MKFDHSRHHTSARLLTTGKAIVLSAMLALSNVVVAEQANIPPELLKKLEMLTKRVEQLEAQAAQRQVVAVAMPANQEVAELRQRLRLVERKQQLVDEETAEQKKKAPVLIAGDKGFGMQSADGKNALKIRGMLQADARMFQQGLKGQHAYLGDTAAQQGDADGATRTATDNFLARRARVIIEGTLDEIYGFRLTPEFGSGSTSLIDAYIDANFHSAAKLRVGKFTPPLGLERLQSSADTKFNELGLTSNFLPSRDIGAQVSGDLFGKKLNYALGYFNGANDGANGDVDPNTDKEIVARVFAQPFADTNNFLKSLGFGIAASSGDAAGRNGNTLLSTYRTSGQENFFSYRTDTSVSNTVFADGTRDRIVPQFSYYQGGFGLTGEYVKEKQDIKRKYGAAANQQRSEEMNNDGWNMTASYILTGETASNKGVKQTKKFSPSSGGWGAWEIVARMGELGVDKDAFYDSAGALGGNDAFAQATRSAQSAQNTGVGVNWYLNNNLRLSLDYEETAFDWGGGGTALNPKDREDESVLLGRVQLAF